MEEVPMPSTWLARPFHAPHRRTRLARALAVPSRERTDAVRADMLQAEFYAATGVALALFSLSAIVIAFISLTE
jgi:hypothetical protein